MCDILFQSTCFLSETNTKCSSSSTQAPHIWRRQSAQEKAITHTLWQVKQLQLQERSGIPVHASQGSLQQESGRNLQWFWRTKREGWTRKGKTTKRRRVLEEVDLHGAFCHAIMLLLFGGIFKDWLHEQSHILKVIHIAGSSPHPLLHCLFYLMPLISI